MTEERKQKMYDRLAIWLPIAVLVLWLSILFTSCKEIEYVPVKEVHTEIEHHHDTITKHDSTYHEKNTIIREVDSAAMAKYGIQLKNAQKAWLIETNELREQIWKLERLREESAYKSDSIPVPYPVEKKLSKWQQFKMDYGGLSMIVSLGIVIFGILWLYLRRTGRRHN